MTQYHLVPRESNGMTPQEEASIHSWHQTVSNDIKLTVRLAGDSQSKALGNFCETFARLAPRIDFQTDDAEPDDLAGIQIAPRLLYHAVPHGTELDPFLEAIQIFHQNESAAGLSGRMAPQPTDLPASLKLFVGPQCPFCATAVRQLLPLVRADENLRLAIIDSVLFTTYARARKIQSVPTLLLDDNFRWTGTLPIGEVTQMINNRDPVHLGAESLRNLLEQGQAGRLAAMMIAHGNIFPALYDLLTHPKWPVRLGAMVVVETLGDQNPALARQVVGPLQKQFNTADPMAQGDILHVIGQAGDSPVIPWLASIGSTTENPEIKEAATDAVQAIQTRSAGP